MRRRDFIKAIAVSTSWPLAAHAQQSSLPVIGFLTGLGRNDRPSLREGFRRGLGDGGYVEGHNLAIEYRFAENQYAQLPTLAADLVGRSVAALAATGSGSAILAAKASTATIPIVFTTVATRCERVMSPASTGRVAISQELHGSALCSAPSS